RGVPSGRSDHRARSGSAAGGRHARRDRGFRGSPGGLSRRGRMKPLEAAGVHSFYGKSHILHGVGLEVNEGEIVTLLGRNGAGKTTTLRSIMGLTPPREGSVTIFGRAASRMPPFEIAGLGIGYVPEGRKIFANLTVEENLKVPLVRPGPWNIERVFQTFP